MKTLSVFAVALHPEGVDRNYQMHKLVLERKRVALHPEGVDRNLVNIINGYWRIAVALHPEGVDRNKYKSDLSLAEASRPPPGGRG